LDSTPNGGTSPSANGSRSSEINEELDTAVYDANFGQRMEAMFEKDLQQSQEYTFEEF
jgi:phosphatidylserine/phosphatidylglycerophosphate/cardiolipin synthase-like enzyme